MNKEEVQLNLLNKLKFSKDDLDKLSILKEELLNYNTKEDIYKLSFGNRKEHYK